MSATSSESTPTPAAGTVVLPPGVSSGPGRETTQTNPQGQVVQGLLVPLTLQSGTTTTVFVPYSQIADTAYVQQLFDARINAIMAIGA